MNESYPGIRILSSAHNWPVMFCFVCFVFFVPLLNDLDGSDLFMTMEMNAEEGELFVSAFFCEAGLVTFSAGAEKYLEEIVSLC